MLTDTFPVASAFNVTVNASVSPYVMSKASAFKSELNLPMSISVEFLLERYFASPLYVASIA